MHTDSSAMPTCFRLRSTVECTATVLMPSVWQARSTRRAISPRLAMTTLSSICASADHEQRFVELDRLTGARDHGEHGAADIGLDLVEHLHGLDDAEDVAGLDGLPDLHEWRCIRIRRGVERADHRRAHD